MVQKGLGKFNCFIKIYTRLEIHPSSCSMGVILLSLHQLSVGQTCLCYLFLLGFGNHLSRGSSRAEQAILTSASRSRWFVLGLTSFIVLANSSWNAIFNLIVECMVHCWDGCKSQVIPNDEVQTILSILSNEHIQWARQSNEEQASLPGGVRNWPPMATLAIKIKSFIFNDTFKNKCWPKSCT